MLFIIGRVGSFGQKRHVGRILAYEILAFFFYDHGCNEIGNMSCI